MDKYNKIRMLGKGSFGSATLIKRRQDGEMFVVKEVNLATMNAKEREEARHEVKVLQQLHHPNIIQYVEHFERRGVLYIVMEFADGGDLHGLLKKQRGKHMKEEKTLHYFAQVCLALEYLHSRHILHRDIKTMNVFLTANGTVKLGDFGISTILRNTCGMAKTVCGTPYYFSPELCKNKPYNNKSDVWALGILLYELATTSHPFDGNSMHQLMQKIVKGGYPPLPSAQYSAEFRSMVGMCLAKEPSKRPSIRHLLQLDILRNALAKLNGDLLTAEQLKTNLSNVIDPLKQQSGGGGGGPLPLAAAGGGAFGRKEQQLSPRAAGAAAAAAAAIVKKKDPSPPSQPHQAIAADPADPRQQFQKIDDFLNHLGKPPAQIFREAAKKAQDEQYRQAEAKRRAEELKRANDELEKLRQRNQDDERKRREAADAYCRKQHENLQKVIQQQNQKVQKNAKKKAEEEAEKKRKQQLEDQERAAQQQQKYERLPHYARPISPSKENARGEPAPRRVPQFNKVAEPAAAAAAAAAPGQGHNNNPKLAGKDGGPDVLDRQKREQQQHAPPPANKPPVHQEHFRQNKKEQQPAVAAGAQNYNNVPVNKREDVQPVAPPPPPPPVNNNNKQYFNPDDRPLPKPAPKVDVRKVQDWVSKENQRKKAAMDARKARRQQRIDEEEAADKEAVRMMDQQILRAQVKNRVIDPELEAWVQRELMKVERIENKGQAGYEHHPAAHHREGDFGKQQQQPPSARPQHLNVPAAAPYLVEVSSEEEGPGNNSGQQQQQQPTGSGGDHHHVGALSSNSNSSSSHQPHYHHHHHPNRVDRSEEGGSNQQQQQQQHQQQAMQHRVHEVDQLFREHGMAAAPTSSNPTTPRSLNEPSLDVPAHHQHQGPPPSNYVHNRRNNVPMPSVAPIGGGGMQRATTDIDDQSHPFYGNNNDRVSRQEKEKERERGSAGGCLYVEDDTPSKHRRSHSDAIVFSAVDVIQGGEKNKGQNNLKYPTPPPQPLEAPGGGILERRGSKKRPSLDPTCVDEQQQQKAKERQPRKRSQDRKANGAVGRKDSNVVIPPRDRSAPPALCTPMKMEGNVFSPGKAELPAETDFQDVPTPVRRWMDMQDEVEEAAKEPKNNQQQVAAAQREPSEEIFEEILVVTTETGEEVQGGAVMGGGKGGYPHGQRSDNYHHHQKQILIDEQQENEEDETIEEEEGLAAMMQIPDPQRQRFLESKRELEYSEMRSHIMDLLTPMKRRASQEQGSTTGESGVDDEDSIVEEEGDLSTDPEYHEQQTIETQAEEGAGGKKREHYLRPEVPEGEHNNRGNHHHQREKMNERPQQQQRAHNKPGGVVVAASADAAIEGDGGKELGRAVHHENNQNHNNNKNGNHHRHHHGKNKRNATDDDEEFGDEFPLTPGGFLQDEVITEEDTLFRLSHLCGEHFTGGHPVRRSGEALFHPELSGTQNAELLRAFLEKSLGLGCFAHVYQVLSATDLEQDAAVLGDVRQRIREEIRGDATGPPLPLGVPLSMLPPTLPPHSSSNNNQQRERPGAERVTPTTPTTSRSSAVSESGEDGEGKENNSRFSSGEEGERFRNNNNNNDVAAARHHHRRNSECQEQEERHKHRKENEQQQQRRRKTHDEALGEHRALHHRHQHKEEGSGGGSNKERVEDLLSLVCQLIYFDEESNSRQFIQQV